MDFRVSFKSGTKQSLQAAGYFSSTAEEAMEDVLAGLTARQYAISLHDGSTLRLRIWSSAIFDEQDMPELLEWLQGIHKDIILLHGEVKHQDLLPQIVENWLTTRHGGVNFFMEQSDGDEPGSPEAMADLSIGVLGGRTVMISTDTFMFTQLQDGVHGLAIANKGSYLIEQVSSTHAVQHLRRA